jgi:tubulin epsilon
VGNGKGPIKKLKARAVLVDMEEGVINEVMRGPLRDLFDRKNAVRA